MSLYFVQGGCLPVTSHTGIVQYDGSETWKDVYAEGTVAKSGCRGISGDVVVTFVCDKGRWIGDDNQCQSNLATWYFIQLAHIL